MPEPNVENIAATHIAVPRHEIDITIMSDAKGEKRKSKNSTWIRWMLEFTAPKSESAPWALQLNNRSLRKEKIIIIIIVYYGRPTDILQHFCHDFIC